jgi:hypothetical protein
MKFALSLLLATALGFAAGNPLGKPLTLKTQTPIADISAKPADFVGKTLQVKGKITEVCQTMGC